MDELGGGTMDRLQNETEKKSRSSRLRRLRMVAAPMAVIAALAGGAVLASACGGGDDGDDSGTPSATRSVSATPRATRTPQSAGLKTPIAFSEGDFLTQADLAARGQGEPSRGPFEGTRLLIPKIGVDAEFTQKVVPGDGQMPNPNGAWDVVWYDFSAFPGMGGVPLAAGSGGNVVLAGHVDYINVGPAVFWDLHTLAPGDEVQIQMADGTVAKYAVEFNKVIDPNSDDWSTIVQATADESVTLITCSGDFSEGHYSNRQIVWGRRIA